MVALMADCLVYYLAATMVAWTVEMLEEMKVVTMVVEMAGSLVEMRVVMTVAWTVALMADCLVFYLGVMMVA